MENQELIMFIAGIVGMIVMAAIVGGWQYKTSGKVGEALIKAIDTFMSNPDMVAEIGDAYAEYVPTSVDSLIDALVVLADGLADGTITQVDDRALEALDKITGSLPKGE